MRGYKGRKKNGNDKNKLFMYEIFKKSNKKREISQNLLFGTSNLWLLSILPVHVSFSYDSFNLPTLGISSDSGELCPPFASDACLICRETRNTKHRLSFHRKKCITYFLLKRLGMEVADRLSNPCTICKARPYLGSLKLPKTRTRGS